MELLLLFGILLVVIISGCINYLFMNKMDSSLRVINNNIRLLIQPNLDARDFLFDVRDSNNKIHTKICEVEKNTRV